MKNILFMTILLTGLTFMASCSVVQTVQIFDASAAGYTDSVERLLDKGVDVNKTDIYDNTPLITAAKEGHADTVRLLVKRGANLNAKNDNGDTAMSLAKDNEHNEVVKILKEAGAKR